MITLPEPHDYAPFYANYVKLATAQGDVLSTLAELQHSTHQFLTTIPDSKADYAYAENKWTIRQLISHMIDAERIFAYRVLCLSRGEQNNLPGFDENSYVLNAQLDERSVQNLADEFKAVRQANIFLYASLTHRQLNSRGLANDTPVSVKALLFIAAGHELHHLSILKERYL